MRIADTLVVVVATRNKLRVWVTERTRTKNVQTFQPDVHRAVYVSTRRMTASFALKLITSLAISFLGVSALTATLACIPRVNLHQRQASSLRLVVKERPQLCEAPSMQRRPLTFSGLYPVADAIKFFDGDSASGAFSETDDLLGNFVVGVGDKA